MIRPRGFSIVDRTQARLTRFAMASGVGDPHRATLYLVNAAHGHRAEAGVARLARELGREVFRIDLSLVVSQHVGATINNLSRLFDEAERSGALLFFDEADALFGRRGEVKDSHDRHASLEIAWLARRLENYPGVVAFATRDPAGAEFDLRHMRRVILKWPP